MDEDLLRYHRHLREIAEADVAYVERKDAQYAASWKRRGGPGAFFTIARPLDRYENFARLAGYDLFAAIEREGLSGPDGSLIACVRDARRYLLLLEAHMTEELAKKRRPTVADDAESTVLDDGNVVYKGPRNPPSYVCAQCDRRLAYDEAFTNGNVFLCHEHYLLSKRVADRTVLVLDEPEAPYVVSWGWLSRNQIVNNEPWRPTALRNIRVLRERLTEREHATLPPQVRSLYQFIKTSSVAGHSWWLCPAMVPPPVMDAYYARRPTELNKKEHEEAGKWGEIYEWTEDEAKWRLRPEMAGWGNL